MSQIEICIVNNTDILAKDRRKWFWIYAYHPGKRIGTIGVREDGFIHDVFVRPAFRCQGIGSLLIKEAEKFIEKNLFFFYTKTTPFEFYEKIGFIKKNGMLIKLP